MKYYKITNEEEKHYGMHYQDGLNVDILPFNPAGDCNPGGIYFARTKEILAFLDYGCWLREVTPPKGEKVYRNPSSGLGMPLKFKAHQVILGPRQEITAEVVERLLKEGANPNCMGHEFTPLEWALHKKDPAMVKALLKHGANIDHGEYALIRMGIDNEDPEFLRFLWEEGVDIHFEHEYTLRLAATRENPDILVAFLITMGADLTEALKWGGEFGTNAGEVLRRFEKPTREKALKLKNKKAK
jgi:hypothetical protein